MFTVCLLVFTSNQNVANVSDRNDVRSGVNVPGIRMVDAVEGVLGLEWIEGKTVRSLLPGGSVDEEDDRNGVDGSDLCEDDALTKFGVDRGPCLECFTPESLIAI